MASEVLKAVRKAIDEGILQVAARLGSAEAWSGLGERTKQHEPFLELLRPLHSERNGHRHLMTDIHEYCEYIAGGYWWFSDKPGEVNSKWETFQIEEPYVFVLLGESIGLFY